LEGAGRIMFHVERLRKTSVWIASNPTLIRIWYFFNTGPEIYRNTTLLVLCM